MNPHPYTFALCTETKLIRARDLNTLSVPLERNAQHCADAYGLPQPAVVIAENRRLAPHLRPVVFVDNESDAGTLAYHYWDPFRNGPASRVLVENTSGFKSGPFSTCESAAHEICEMIVNAMLSEWLPYPVPRSDERVQVAKEVADPTQDTYAIEHAGDAWPVANFVRPAWFERDLSEPAAARAFLSAGGRFDHAGRMKAAGDLSPEGYMVLRSPDDRGGYRYWNEWGGAGALARSAQRKAAAAHPWSRTLQLAAGAPQQTRPTAP